jgi:hypothetical protein
VLSLVLLAPFALAGKPEISFALVDGWVETRVEHDGKPVPKAIIRVFDVIGAPYAEGETAENGVGSFPKPREHTCRVAMNILGKECESILLRFDKDNKIYPPRVQVTFNDRSCCVVPSVRSGGGSSDSLREETPVSSDWEDSVILLSGAIGILLLSAAVAIYLWYRPGPSS